ncbi:MAG: WD40/YVTN/BNR-like repeat-containing protein, partial [bacterium]
TSQILSIVVDPSNHKIIYVLVIDEGIYKSTDGGSTWQLYASNPDPSFFDIAIDPNNTQVLYGATGTNAGLIVSKSTDSGITWKDTALPAGYIYVNPVDSNIVYSVGLIGVVMSLDGGMTIKPIGPTIPSNILVTRNYPLGFAIDTSNYNILYLAADGVYKYY